MIVLSLFDGCSCAQVALKRSNITITKYYASEVDKYVIETTQKNFPDTIQLGDVKNWKEWNIPKPDLIVGGSPCQGFSFAGKKLNFEDDRSKLFFEYVDIVHHFQPKYFLFENVKMKKEYENIITKLLGVKPVEINSALVSAQTRKRLYWCNWDLTQPADKKIYLKDIVLDNVDKKYYLTDVAKERLITINKRAEEKGLGYKDCIIDVYRENSKFRNLDANFFKGPDGKRGVLLTDDLRTPTPLECERLQTLPDDYTDGVSNSQRYKMLGNGFTVDVISHILECRTDVPKKLNVNTDYVTIQKEVGGNI